MKLFRLPPPQILGPLKYPLHQIYKLALPCSEPALLPTRMQIPLREPMDFSPFQLRAGDCPRPFPESRNGHLTMTAGPPKGGRFCQAHSLANMKSCCRQNSCHKGATSKGDVRPHLLHLSITTGTPCHSHTATQEYSPGLSGLRERDQGYGEIKLLNGPAHLSGLQFS